MLRPWELQIEIDTSADWPVYIQIADAIIAAIKAAKLNRGDVLPGSRQLAKLLKVNRNTIVEALDVLLAEGWLLAKERKGTFVADNLPAFREPQAKAPMSAGNTSLAKPEIFFDDGLPDTKIAPIAELAAAYRQVFKQKARWQLMGYSQTNDDLAFREAIIQMLNYKRGMRLSVDELFITRGSQMAMYLMAHCLLKQGDLVMVENPGYKPAWMAFQHAGAVLLPLSVDEDGLVINEVEEYLRRYKSIKALYMTPHHQFPTTVTLSLQRRLELISLSNRYGFTLIEDDYDNEFHFGQRPILPVSSFESIENYVYIGTMSKIVAPAVRIGYLASSKELVDKMGSLRKIIDIQGDNIMAQAILQLINEGHIKRHLRKATLLYRNKRDFFERLIQEYLADKVKFQKPEGGLAFWLVPIQPIDIEKTAKMLVKKGIQIISPREYSFSETICGLRLGYASLNESQLEDGIKALAMLL